MIRKQSLSTHLILRKNLLKIEQKEEPQDGVQRSEDEGLADFRGR
jgi:hypothetical protein